MDYANYIVKCITDEISEDILSRAFVSRNKKSLYTLEDRIYQEVVMDRVHLDTDLLGGQEMMVPLDGITPIQTDSTFIYSIPASRVNGKRILSAMSIELPYNEFGAGGLAGAMEGPYSTATTNIRLSGINTIELTEQIPRAWLFLRCRVGDEPNYQNWNSRYIPLLGELAVLACKMICYTRLNTTLGDGTTNAGSINNYLRSELDTMSDAAAMYKEMLKTRYRKAAIMKDPISAKRAIEAVMPNLF